LTQVDTEVTILSLASSFRIDRSIEHGNRITYERSQSAQIKDVDA